ncbi:MAG: hypothetical protein H6722_19580 [Sandaracinus sp.]|nr:hypothetical protein [Sandaracinus sp.]
MLRRTPWLLLALALAHCAAEPPHAPTAAVVALEHVDSWPEGGDLDVYFVPSGDEVEDRIADEVLAAERSVRVALYNLRSERLADLLLRRHHEGLEVELFLDAKQMDKPWNVLGHTLQAAGLPVVAVRNERSEYATLHDKMAVLDDELVIFGSANWGHDGLHENDETLLVLRSAPLAAVVDGELDELHGPRVRRAGDVEGPAQLYFSPTDRLDRVLETAIDGARERIVVAVFSLRLSWLVEALVEAHERGVEVWVITDEKQSSTTDLDERLRDAGVPIVEARNTATEFSAMHHKWMVVDGRETFVGSYNWTYTATFHNHEDLARITSQETAAAFEGEMGRLWDRYADSRAEEAGLAAYGRAHPSTTHGVVRFAGVHDATAFGDTLVVVGDAPELGAWDPRRGLRLDGATWPTWRAEASLRAGARVEYKLVVLRADGGVRWESGGNRTLLVPTDGAALEVSDAFRL